MSQVDLGIYKRLTEIVGVEDVKEKSSKLGAPRCDSGHSSCQGNNMRDSDISFRAVASLNSDKS
jgi:hypothetical protein